MTGIWDRPAACPLLLAWLALGKSRGDRSHHECCCWKGGTCTLHSSSSFYQGNSSTLTGQLMHMYCPYFLVIYYSYAFHCDCRPVGQGARWLSLTVTRCVSLRHSTHWVGTDVKPSGEMHYGYTWPCHREKQRWQKLQIDVKNNCKLKYKAKKPMECPVQECSN